MALNGDTQTVQEGVCDFLPEYSTHVRCRDHLLPRDLELIADPLSLTLGSRP